jgi:hypothetical protein
MSLPDSDTVLAAVVVLAGLALLIALLVAARAPKPDPRYLRWLAQRQAAALTARAERPRRPAVATIVELPATRGKVSDPPSVAIR